MRPCTQAFVEEVEMFCHLNETELVTPRNLNVAWRSKAPVPVSYRQQRRCVCRCCLFRYPHCKGKLPRGCSTFCTCYHEHYLSIILFVVRRDQEKKRTPRPGDSLVSQTLHRCQA